MVQVHRRRWSNFVLAIRSISGVAANHTKEKRQPLLKKVILSLLVSLLALRIHTSAPFAVGTYSAPSSGDEIPGRSIKSAHATSGILVGEEDCHRPRPFDVSSLLNDGKLKTLPKPWIHIGPPKTGTTTLEKFWKCGLNQQPMDDLVSHSTCKVSSEALRKMAFKGRGIPKNPLQRCPSSKVAPCQFCGKCMGKAHNLSMPLLASCGNYDAWAQMDSSESCYYPQWDYLDRIHEEEPDATLVFMFRNVTEWINSVLHFRKGTLIENLDRCRPKHWRGRQHLKAWYCAIVKHARNFVAEHPSHIYLEIDLDNVASSHIASRAFGIEKSCWGVHNVNTFLHRNVSRL
jgi:hypothetical protein